MPIADTYEVKPGDTLSRIASKFGLTLDALLDANKQITNRDLINIGQKINIPGTPSPAVTTPAPGQPQVYDGHHPAPGTTSTSRALYSHPPLTNSSGQRDTGIYSQLINQFAVGDNPRHLAGHGKTYCNIFVWDVSRAMGAEVPHWINAAGNIAAPGAAGANEININGGVNWMKSHGVSEHDWRKATPAQAQDAANQGLISVVMWKNPTGGHGHTAVIRPGSINNKGPEIAQAGRHNFNRGRITDGFGNLSPLEYFIHD
jgi:LysM repeat protein